MGLGKLAGMDQIKEIKRYGEAFQNYWIAVSEDLKSLTEAMNKNFAQFQETFNGNMSTVNDNIMELNEKIDKILERVSK